MIDINLYRLRIGTYLYRGRKMKNCDLNIETSNKVGSKTLVVFKLLIQIFLISFLFPSSPSSFALQYPSPHRITCTNKFPVFIPALQFCIQSKRQTNNYKAKYKLGNIMNIES